MRAKAKIVKSVRNISDTDMELIKLLGLPDKVISVAMDLNHGAVRMKITRLAIKLGVENRTAIVIRSLSLGLITPAQLVFRNFDVGAYSETNTS